MQASIPAKVIAKLIQESGRPIALIGSANLAAQGITIPFSDLDFLTDDLGARHFATLLGESPDASTGFLEFWTEVDGTTVNFTSYQGNPLREEFHETDLVHLQIDGVSVPCMPLGEELRFYERAGRQKDVAKATLIRQFLEQKTLSLPASA